MSSLTMLLQLFLFLLFYALAIRLVRKVRNLPPSPFLELPIIGHLFLISKKPLHKTLVEISRRNGPITLLQLGYRRVVLVSSPSAAEECLSTNDIIFANRPKLLSCKYAGNNYTSLACSSYGNHWRNLRKIASLEILSSHRIHTLSDIRADEVRLLVERLMRNHDDAVNMKVLLFEMIFNMMMRMIAGRRYFGDNVAEVKEVEHMLRESFAISGMSFMGDYLHFLRWIGYGNVEKRMKCLKGMRDDFMQALVEDHRRNDSDGGGMKKTLIQVLLSLQKAEPEYYNDDMIRSLMLVLLSAGTDTSSSTLEWALSLLLNHPQVLTKAQSEIDQVVGFERLIEEHDLEKLPYLNCIITETLRMHPPGPLLPHESSQECHLGGYRIPAGTMLLINVYDIHNDPRNWADVLEFRPERFEGARLAGAREHVFRLMPFGYGRRGCPGENLAMQMLGLGLGSLIQCFNWERIGDELVDMAEGIGLTVPKDKPLMAHCKPRSFLPGILVRNLKKKKETTTKSIVLSQGDCREDGLCSIWK